MRTVYLSLDPYMRGRMSDAPSYAPPVAIGATMVGGTVSRVLESRHADHHVGDWVGGMTGWQDFGLSDGNGLRNLGADLPHPSLALGVLGMPGFTAYMGLIDIGRPEAGETVVVAAATGAVGSVVGQIAKRRGAYVVGIAGGPEKCQWAVDGLGFDACLDHREPDLAHRLAAACSDGSCAQNPDRLHSHHAWDQIPIGVSPAAQSGTQSPLFLAVSAAPALLGALPPRSGIALDVLRRHRFFQRSAAFTSGDL